MAIDADVIVAGAGPAGAVAALRLARAGVRVILCDRATFPRDKACGDGLIADSIAALKTLGLDRQVADASFRTNGLLILSPGGTEVRFQSTFWVLPRLSFDRILFDAAVNAGAAFQHVIIEAPIVENGQITGVTGRRPGGGERVTFRAPLTLLATGGNSAILKKFDDKARSDASGVAIRTVHETREHDAEGADHLARARSAARIRVGVSSARWPGECRHRRAARARRWRRRSQSATAAGRFAGGTRLLGRLLGPQKAVTPYQGAPLRTGLTGSQFSRPGLVIIGEAAGTTYALTGEGIGKAMESGILAADLAIAATPQTLPLIGRGYADTMRARYAPRFRTYDIAQRWNAYPFVTDFFARRANRSQWVHERLTRVITEQALPTHVFSARTIWRLLTHG